MTNIFRNQKGVATLLITVIMIASITLIILFAASYNRMQEQIISNSYQNTQAYEAAEAGLEFGIVYLQQNSAAILANPVNGYIPAYSSASTQNVSLTDSSKFTITFTNPVQNNYTLISISSTGTSSDGTSTRTISQKVALGSLLSTPPTIPLISKGSVTMSGNALISNSNLNSTINSASTVAFSGNAATTIVNGATGSNKSGVNGDVQQNNATINAMSNTTFFQTYFGSTEAAVQPTVKHYYSNASSTNYSATLDGMTGTSIWIDQTGGQATLSGNPVIGTAANPVLLIVNGNLNISGNAVIWGFVYVIGGVATSLTGNSVINGGVVSTDNLSLSGNTTIKFNTTVLSGLQQQVEASYFAKVPGTWKDF
jgi:Tfp pilus assembly protein PilX